MKRGLADIVGETTRDSGRGETTATRTDGSKRKEPDRVHSGTTTVKESVSGAHSSEAQTLPDEGRLNSLGNVSSAQEEACKLVSPPFEGNPHHGIGSTKSSSPAATTTEKTISHASTAETCLSPCLSHEHVDSHREFETLACELRNQAITCRHGKLDPEESRNTRVVSAVSRRQVDSISILSTANPLRCRTDCVC